MAKLTNQEYKILMEAHIDLTGYEDIKKVIEGSKSSQAAIQKLAEFTGMLKAMADTISQISKSGFKADLQGVAKIVNQSISTFDSMPDVKNKFYGLPDQGPITKEPKKILAYETVARAKMTEVGGVLSEANSKLLLNLQKQLNAEKEKTYKITRDIVKVEKPPKTERQSIESREKAMERKRLAKDEADADIAAYRAHKESVKAAQKEHADQVRREQAEKIKAEQRAVKDAEQLALRREKERARAEQQAEKERLSAAKQAEKERQRLIKERERAEKKAQREVDEMNRKSEAERIRTEKKVSQEKERLRKADEKAKAKQEREEEERRKKSFGGRIKEFFSIEKLVSRMSFVITAKLSYDLFNMISRLPGKILRTWREFQAEISKTFALLANETKLTKDKLTNDVINLSKTYGIAAKEISTALYEVISAQVGVADASKVLEEAIKLSISGGGDITTAAHSLVQLMNAYDIAFSQAGRVSDIAFQTVKYGQLTLQQYTDQMSKVVATASILKIPLEEISAAIATMTINGINADQAFTALNQMLMTIANPTEKSKKLLSELGYNLSIGEVQAKGLGGALSELIPMLDMTGSANEELITILFKNRTGFKAVASLLQNMPDYYQNYIRMVDSAGAAEEGLAERTNTVDFQMNRLKTTWEALMMMFIQGNNQSVVSFYKSLANNIDKLTKNSYLLFGVIKSIGIAIAGVGLKYLLASLSKLTTMIKMIPAQLGLVAGAAKVTWASVTGGLSLVITLLAEAIMIIDQFAKKIRDRAFDKSFGLDKLEQDLKNAELDIKKFDNNLGKLNSVKTMISQWDSLNKVQNKNKQQNEALTRVYSGIKTILNGVGIKIDETGDKTANLMQYLAKVDSEITRVSNRLSSRIIEKSATESLKNIGLAQKAAPDAGDKDLGIRTQLGFNLAKKAIEEVENIIKTGDFTKIANKAKQQEANVQAKIDELRQILSGKRTYVDIHGRNVQETWDLSEKQKQNISSTLDALDASMTFLLDSQKISMETYNIPDYVPKTEVDTSGGGGGKPGEFSVLDESKSLFRSLLGENIFETIEELKSEMNSRLKEIRSKITKSTSDGQRQLDIAETQAYLNSIEALLDDDKFIQIFEEGNRAVSSLLDKAKQLKDAGDISGAEQKFKEAETVKNEFESIIKQWFDQDSNEGLVYKLMDAYPFISSFTDKQMDGVIKHTYDEIKYFGYTGTGEEWEATRKLGRNMLKVYIDGIEQFRHNATNSLIELQSTFMTGAKEALSDDDFIQLALTSFGIDTNVTSNWDALTKAIEDAEEEGFVAKTEFLKFIADNTMTAYKDFLTEMFDLDQPEYVKEAINAIKSKIDNDKIVDKKLIQELIEEVIKKLLSLGKNVSQEDRDAITKGVMPDTDTEIKKGFDWKSVVGIADYENDNEAILDISKQAVSQLQAVWSFYWDWEIRQLQKQHDKKLQLLEDEKSIMLANENMSAQQRAIIEERFEEKKRAMQERMDKEMAAQKKKQAIFNASIDFARGLIGIWSSELSKGIFGLATAPILSGLLAGIFATQLALINNQKFAKGGYTGSGVGSPDETGYRPAGIVHEGELVIDKKTLDRGNLNPLMSIYQAMKSGQSFDAAAANYLMGNLQTKMPRPINSGMFAGGGYVGKNKSMLQSQEITIDFKGMKVLDPVELNRLVIDVGGKKRRKIGE